MDFKHIAARFEAPVQDPARSMAHWAVLAMCFSAGLSKSLFATSALFLLAGWLFSGTWRQLKRSPVAGVWVTLIAWMYLSSMWSEGTSSTITHSMGVQWKLFLIPVISTLITDRRWLERCWYAFAIGMLVLLLHVYALPFPTITWTTTQDPRGVFYNPLPQSVGLAIFAVWCLFQVLTRKTLIVGKTLFLMGFFSSAYAVLQISLQRLGYLSLLFGVAAVLALCLPPRKRLIGAAGLVSMTLSLVLFSPQIQTRIEQAQQDIQSYNFKSNYSSLGARLHMWVVSLKAIQDAPLVGHGIGSYPVVSERAFDDAQMCSQGCDHPHNQYLYYALEFGLVGLCLFLFAVLQTICLYRRQRKASTMPVVVLTVFIMVGFADTTLWYRGYLHLFIPLLGIASAAIRPEAP